MATATGPRAAHRRCRWPRGLHLPCELYVGLARAVPQQQLGFLFFSVFNTIYIRPTAYYTFDIKCRVPKTTMSGLFRIRQLNSVAVFLNIMMLQIPTALARKVMQSHLSVCCGDVLVPVVVTE